MRTYFDLEVCFRRIEPPIWRRFLLDSRATFADLHRAIQDAGPWLDSHLYLFTDRRRVALAGLPYPESEDPDASEVGLSTWFRRKGSGCVYYYDFGDSWALDVVLRGMVDSDERFERRLIGGDRAFPPEDCGGVPGYEACVEAAGASGRGLSEEIRHRQEWLGEWKPDGFDLSKARLRFDRPRSPERSLAPGSGATTGAGAFSYTNRFGVKYFLHRTTGKGGAIRYAFKKKIGEGALGELPEGFTVRESVNGLVSVARAQAVGPADEGAKVVRSFLERQPRLREVRVETKGRSILVHEPVNLIEPESLPESLRSLLRGRSLPQSPLRYAPVLRFDLEDEAAGTYHVRRMTYRGEGGWSYPLDSGRLDDLVERYLPTLGTDDFFELM